MIQRSQSLYLLLAALACAAILFVDLYHYQVVEGGVTVAKALHASDHYVSMALIAVITALPLVTVFQFRHRQRQLRMSVISIAGCGSFISTTLWRVSEIKGMNPPPVSQSYWIGALLPILAIVFLVMAIVGIRRDEQLVQSMDRLR